MVQAIEQGTCTNCGEQDGNYTVENRQLAEGGAGYEMRCTCGAYAAVAIEKDGIRSTKTISHDEASWNTETQTPS